MVKNVIKISIEKTLADCADKADFYRFINAIL